MAAAMGVSQSAISKIERRPDLSVGVLRDYVRALGGELEVSARFADRVVPLAANETSYTQRSPLRKVAERPAFVMPEDWAAEVIRIRSLSPAARMEEVANLTGFFAEAKRVG